VILAFAVWVSRSHRESIPVIASLWRTQLVLIWIGILSAGGVVASLAVPVDVSSASPASVLDKTRWVYVLHCVAALATIATAWLWAGTTIAIAAACVAVARIAIVAALGSTAGGAWPRYVEARLRLAVRRRLPWRTMSFLSDAHRRGVLRQVGAAYQFRHIRLQEQLAVGYSPWPPSLAPWIGYMRGAFVGIWTFVQGHFMDWRADSQTISISTDTVSGVIAARSPRDGVRQQLASGWALLSIAGLVALFAGLNRWYYGITALFLLAVAFTTLYHTVQHRQNAGLGIVPSNWSLRVTPDCLYVLQDGSAAFLKMADLERVVARRVRNPDGVDTEWIALCARIREGCTVHLPTYEEWLPLIWLTTKSTAKGYRAMPQLQAALQWFPKDLLSGEMADIKKEIATECWASGLLVTPRIPWMRCVLSALAFILVASVTGQAILVFMCVLYSIIMISICWVRLSQRAALRLLPRGSWSLHVTPEEIQLEINGIVTHLTPDQVEETDIRMLRDSKGRRTLFSTMQVRFRPGEVTPYPARDGWFPVYLKPIFGESRYPTELLAALHRFAGDRVGYKFASLTELRGIQQS
jgi:hypothetical protein